MRVLTTKRTTRFQINDNDIRGGLKRSPCLCPAALSITRTLGIVISDVMVSRSFIGIGPYDIRCPENLKDWIGEFDCFGPATAKPLDFELPVGISYGWRAALRYFFESAWRLIGVPRTSRSVKLCISVRRSGSCYSTTRSADRWRFCSSPTRVVSNDRSRSPSSNPTLVRKQFDGYTGLENS